METLLFTLLAQVWEVLAASTGRRLPPGLSNQVLAYLAMEEGERQTFPYIYLIRLLQQWLAAGSGEFFVEELAGLSEKFNREGSPFTEACSRLEALRVQLFRYPLAQQAVPLLCRDTEQSLAVIFGELGFLARYTLATVKNIDILKYKHQNKNSAIFKHTLVRLIDLLGQFEENPQRLRTFMDNRSVLLLKEEEGADSENMAPFLNLSPFILDKNAFIVHQEVSQVHFFCRYEADSERLYYRHVFKPADAFWEIGPDEEEPLDAIYEQFVAFLELLNPTKPVAL